MRFVMTFFFGCFLVCAFLLAPVRGWAQTNPSEDNESLIPRIRGCAEGKGELQPARLSASGFSESQKADLTTLLSGTGVRTRIAVVGSDGNAARVGSDVRSILKASGWPSEDSIHFDCALPPNLVGVVLLINHADFPEATLLQIALRRAGLRVRVEVDESQSLVREKDLILIAIGTKLPGNQ